MENLAMRTGCSRPSLRTGVLTPQVIGAIGSSPLLWLWGPLTDASAAAWHRFDTDPACQGPA
ncbi:hypothetical protein ACWCQV_42975, partial [Streptomyces eurythermus]